ncbi:3168_t:CDS:2, partial [Dentiscutata erythropus]
FFSYGIILKVSSPTASLQSSTSFPQSFLTSFSPMTSSNCVRPHTTLRSEVEDLNARVEELEAELKTVKEELETFKNPGTTSLRTILNEMSLKLLKDSEEDAKKKANEIKRKKEIAAQKQIKREAKKEQAEKAKKEN